MTAAAGARPSAIAFLGLGLIGGSIVKALRAAQVEGQDQTLRISAWSPGGHGAGLAVADGLIDLASTTPEAAIEGADLIVIAAPPLATIQLIVRLGGELRTALADGAVVTDVSSTKGAVMRAAGEAGLRFVGGHPMAGREVAGYEGSGPDLFRDRPWIVVPGPSADAGALAAVRWLATASGARPFELDAATHDAAVAAISHLPLVASTALVEAVAGGNADAWALERSLAASGWEGMTRLARGDARMAAGIAVTNAEALVAVLVRYRGVIDEWIAALSEGPANEEALARRFDAARADLLAGREA